jgi:16S rRNA U516 pseudouridylate synthase RsuA-like enzyme
VVKIFNVMQARFRWNRKRYLSVFLTVCGLVRVRIGAVTLEAIRSAESGTVSAIVSHHRFPMKLNPAA